MRPYAAGLLPPPPCEPETADRLGRETRNRSLAPRASRARPRDRPPCTPARAYLQRSEKWSYHLSNERSMSEPSPTRKIEAIVGFGVAVSAFLWLVTLPPPRDVLSRIGFISALNCAAAAMAFFWAMFFAHIILKRKWPPHTSSLA